jgi:outer membrane protein with beta-barrel domain
VYSALVTVWCRRLRRALATCAVGALACAGSSPAAAKPAGGAAESRVATTNPFRNESPGTVVGESDEPATAAQYGYEASPDQSPIEGLTPDANQEMPYVLPGDGGPSCPSGPLMNPACPPPRCLPLLQFLGLRHSYTDGRNVGYGWPLVGTSWLNRPYYVGGTLGLLGTANRIEDNVRPDVDVFGGLIVGWDWDYYWGSEVQFERSTPEFTNRLNPTVPSGEVMNLWSYDAMYYPWGDSAVRPYWRLGLGSTYVDYVSDGGHRRDEELWTFPIGVGVKYPIYHWLAARFEFTDHLALGNRGVNTLNDLTLTCGLEWHFGAHPQSYWPWNPSRHMW